MIRLSGTKEVTTPAIMSHSCEDCLHYEVCKFVEDNKELFNKVSLLLEEKEERIVDIKLECKKFVNKNSANAPWHIKNFEDIGKGNEHNAV